MARAECVTAVGGHRGKASAAAHPRHRHDAHVDDAHTRRRSSPCRPGTHAWSHCACVDVSPMFGLMVVSWAVAGQEGFIRLRVWLHAAASLTGSIVMAVLATAAHGHWGRE